ncbi:MAG: transposase [Deltaproteobacteria bacterium]|nr:transposase [Deltaproteobacteria bacterium]
MKERMDGGEWKRRVEEQAASGMSAAAYCRKHGIKENTFHYWRSKLGKRRPDPGSS